VIRSAHVVASLATGLILGLSSVADAQQAAPITIEKLLADGWEVAGYIAAWETARSFS
jgi:hypothetical protein